ncbi:MAG: hypothetical protein K6A37_09760 [Saccharofermentans sp.]|nr:hypothetical protein [Saccharofermentans sp.]
MKRFRTTAAALAAVMVMSSLPVQAVFADEIEETEPASEPAAEEVVDEEETPEEVTEESVEETVEEITAEEEEVVFDIEDTEVEETEPSEEIEVVEDDVTFEAEEAGGIAVDATNFPDANFRSYVINDLGVGDVLEPSEIASITSIDLSPYRVEYTDSITGQSLSYSVARGITDLTGIEYFTAVTDLNISYNNLSTVDLSALTNLQTLTCKGSGLTALDVSNNRALRYLNFNNDAPNLFYPDSYPNTFTSINLTNNTQLTEIRCEYNKLTSLNVSTLTNLEYLNCYGNNIDQLDVTNNTHLVVLGCSGNSIPLLNVSNCTDLQELYCASNQLQNLDVTQNTDLERLDFGYNQIQSINVSNNTSLSYLLVEDNPLATIDISNNPGLLHHYYCGRRETGMTGMIFYSGGSIPIENGARLLYLGVDPDDTIVTGVESGWVKVWREGPLWIYLEDGAAVSGWRKIGGSWYYFKPAVDQWDTSKCFMLTGWQELDGSWYYFKSSGAMATGWQKIGSSWYYFKSGGAMINPGWQKIGSSWYYFKSSGAMATGWQKISNKWYYFASSGAMKTGWMKSGSKWYYFESSGAMLANCSRKIGSKTYRFDANGVCLNP